MTDENIVLSRKVIKNALDNIKKHERLLSDETLRFYSSVISGETICNPSRVTNRIAFERAQWHYKASIEKLTNFLEKSCMDGNEMFLEHQKETETQIDELKRNIKTINDHFNGRIIGLYLFGILIVFLCGLIARGWA